MVSRALLKVGGSCNSDCRFCHAGGPAPAGSDLSTREVCRRILGAARAGHDGVVLSGGEPAAREDLVTLARFAARAGLDFGLVTNGIALAEPRLRRAVVEAGLAYVHLSLHGPDAQTHDALAGVPSFEDATRAIEALARERLALAVTTVACRPNLPGLVETAALVADLVGPAPRLPGWPRHRLALVEPKGRAARDAAVLPDLDEAAQAIGGALAEPGGEGRIHRGHDGLPPCLAPAGSGGSDDLRAHGITAMQEAHEVELFPTDAGLRGHAGPCQACALRPSCPGVYAGYLPAGASCLVPM